MNTILLRIYTQQYNLLYLLHITIISYYDYTHKNLF